MVGLPRRQAGLTALYLGVFAAVWFSVPKADPPLRSLLVVGSVAALLAAAAGAVLVVRAGRRPAGERDRSADRRYGLIVVAEFAVALIGGLLLAAAGLGGYVPVLIGAVVGVHFVPLAPVLRDRPLVPLGVAVTLVALAGLVVGLVSGVSAGLVVGTGTGALLLAYALLGLLRAASGRLTDRPGPDRRRRRTARGRRALSGRSRARPAAQPTGRALEGRAAKQRGVSTASRGARQGRRRRRAACWGGPRVVSRATATGPCLVVRSPLRPPSWLVPVAGRCGAPGAGRTALGGAEAQLEAHDNGALNAGLTPAAIVQPAVLGGLLRGAARRASQPRRQVVSSRSPTCRPPPGADTAAVPPSASAAGRRRRHGRHGPRPGDEAVGQPLRRVPPVRIGEVAVASCRSVPR